MVIFRFFIFFCFSLPRAIEKPLLFTPRHSADHKFSKSTISFNCFTFYIFIKQLNHKVTARIFRAYRKLKVTRISRSATADAYKVDFRRYHGKSFISARSLWDWNEKISFFLFFFCHILRFENAPGHIESNKNAIFPF